MKDEQRLCLRCGMVLESRRCKLLCPRCGYTEDCADAGLIEYDRIESRPKRNAKVMKSVTTARLLTKEAKNDR